MTGSFDGAAQGAFYGAIGAMFAYGIGEKFLHGRSFFHPKGDFGAAVLKAAAHGVSRAFIAKAQNQGMKAAFWSGFISSGFSVGTEGYGGKPGRTMIMATVGGTVSEITGGKFANGAVSGAFVHLFNAENGFIEFAKGAGSIGRGLYRLGDYIARISGFRDWQDGSVMGDFYQDEAKQETINFYKTTKYIIINKSARRLFIESATKYISSRPEYFAGRVFAGPLVGFAARNPVWSAGSTFGDVAYSSEEIDRFTRNIVLGY